ncbi:MAG: sigma 54-interacting transcriptional regulator [Enhygromyxa sp.]
MNTTTQHTGDLTSPTSGPGRTQKARRPGQLEVRLTGGDAAKLALSNGSTITFGRSRASQVVIDDASVSKIHFSLRALDGGVELEDLGSKNGTWFRGRKVRRITLMPGDRFRAGACEVELLEVGQVDVEVATESECGLLYGESVAMRELFATIEKLAPLPLDLLIFGETGTGKELTARTIHDLSPRKDQPFVILDCSTLPANLADATIFGFRRGAFTGAEYEQPGLFEQAHGGTLFIDELGELSPELQMKFLRALDRRQVARLGEPGKLREVDVRIVAATNRDLNAEMRAGRFREDLFHRVAHGKLHLPPLRDRGLDVILLAERFLRELAGEGEPVELADDARTALATYDWPGNVRELKNAIRRTAYVCSDGVIKLEDLDLGRSHGWSSKLARTLEDSKSHNYESLHLLVDRIYLPAVLAEHQSITASARHLGISRVRLRARLKALGLYDADDS